MSESSVAFKIVVNENISLALTTIPVLLSLFIPISNKILYLTGIMWVVGMVSIFMLIGDIRKRDKDLSSSPKIVVSIYNIIIVPAILIATMVIAKSQYKCNTQ